MQTEKQRERLVELITEFENNKIVRCPKYDEPTCDGCEYDLGTECDKTSIFADYLLANNVIVPPMKLGQSCFNTCSYRNDVDECRVSSITQKVDGTFKIRLTNLRGKWVFEITEKEIGKRVFLERTEAEAKLREMQNEN